MDNETLGDEYPPEAHALLWNKKAFPSLSYQELKNPPEVKPPSTSVVDLQAELQATDSRYKGELFFSYFWFFL